MKIWLREANGWQRLWFFITFVVLFFSILILPLRWTSASVNSDLRQVERVTAEMTRYECDDYLTKPIAELKKPDYDQSAGCYYLYNYRVDQSNADDLPLTKEKLENNSFWYRWGQRFLVLAFVVSITMVISGFVYFLGLAIKWIREGFRKKDS